MKYIKYSYYLINIKLKESHTQVIFGTKSIKKNNVLFVKERDFQSPPFELESTIKAIKEIKNIQKNRILDGKTITELFFYQDANLWWFMYTEVFKKLATIIEFIMNFSNFIKTSKPSIVKIEDDFIWMPIIEQICKKHGIKIQLNQIGYLKFKNQKRIEKRLRKQRANIITKRKISRRIKLFKNKSKVIPSLDNKIIFAAGLIFRRHIFNFENGKIEKGEYLLQDIKNLLNNEKPLGIDFFTFVNADDQILRERLNDSSFEWIPVEIFLKKNKNNHNNFLKKYLKIINSKNFRKLFSFNEIQYWDVIELVFEKFTFSYYIEYWLHLLDSLYELLSKETPKVIFLPIETGPLALAFIIVSKKFKIKTIGLQHGWIQETHFAYNHETFFSSKNNTGFPLPDRLMLFGDLSKESLIKKGYPSKNLSVLGNPVFFNISTLDSNLPKKLLREKYKIKENQKIILFAPPGYRDYFFKGSKFLYNEQIWRQLLENFGNKDEYYLILKPHPADTTNVYKEILDKNNVSNASVLQGSIIELTHISDIVLSTLSTSITDALCLKKPVIQVKFENIKFDAPFDNFGAVYVTNINELSQSIEKVLNSQEIKNQLLKNSESFLKKFYNIPIENPQQKLKDIIKNINN